MKQSTYLKASLRELKQSKGRFLSIMLIIFLGVFLFVGVKAAAPSLQYSANQQLKKQQLADIQLISTGGLTKDDLNLLKKQSDVLVEEGYILYYADKEKNQVFELLSYNPEDQLNRLQVVAGHLPKQANELVLDERAKKSGYKIGDQISLDLPSDLKQQDYKIVGFVKSPLFVAASERGSAPVGNGSVDYFIYLPVENFKGDIYSTLYLQDKKLNNLAVYTKDYQQKIDKRVKQLETILRPRIKQRADEIKEQAQQPLTKAKAQIDQAKQQIAAGKAQLEQAQQQVQKQLAQIQLLPDSSQKQALLTQIQASENELNQKQTNLNNQLTTLSAQEQTLAKQQAKIDALKAPKYLFYTKDENAGVKSYIDLTTQIAGIANVFPVFFFFIAALITFSTMTRMVEENRREIGILKALGYSKLAISKKYILYASLATIIGIILGTIAGSNSLPLVINMFLKSTYSFDHLQLTYDWVAITQATIACFFASLGAVFIVLVQELRTKPAMLLLPKAPKPGKRILLEYITPIWSKLSFNQKVSYRNIFRYKSRMIMAIIGIAGCTGLMVAGVGLKNSLESVIDKQFGPIIHYQGLVALNEHQEDHSAFQSVEQVLAKYQQVKSTGKVYLQPMEVKHLNQASQSVPMLIFNNQKEQRQFLTLNSLDQQEQLSLPENGVIITQPLAKSMHLANGDQLKLTNNDGQEFTVKVAAVANYYVGNYLIGSKQFYEKYFATDYQANALLLKTKVMSKQQEKQLSKALLATNDVSNVTLITGQIHLQKQMTENLDIVVIIFVVLSGMLALVVLYNLTNINISERIRELSTIKVLGFFNREVTMYIVRENIIFTLLGIIVGYGIGYILTGFILNQISMNQVVFPIVILPIAYLLAAGMTIIFTVIVMVITHFRLQHINMIDALKSNE
ncbi:MAG TPA: FtsX-like permease family protein [Enterococcus columbae]|nr:FtsX-like permease family protein [Enterococcus columbae]